MSGEEGIAQRNELACQNEHLRSELTLSREARAKVEEERDAARKERDDAREKMARLREQRDAAKGRLDGYELLDRVEESCAPSLTAQLAGALATIAALREEGKALREALGMDTPWPCHVVLTRLADAVAHGLGAHSCDHHGHEGDRYAEQAARKISDALSSALASAPDTSLPVPPAGHDASEHDRCAPDECDFAGMIAQGFPATLGGEGWRTVLNTIIEEAHDHGSYGVIEGNARAMLSLLTAPAPAPVASAQGRCTGPCCTPRIDINPKADATAAVIGALPRAPSLDHLDFTMDGDLPLAKPAAELVGGRDRKTPALIKAEHDAATVRYPAQATGDGECQACGDVLCVCPSVAPAAPQDEARERVTQDYVCSACCAPKSFGGHAACRGTKEDPCDCLVCLRAAARREGAEETRERAARRAEASEVVTYQHTHGHGPEDNGNATLARAAAHIRALDLAAPGAEGQQPTNADAERSE